MERSGHYRNLARKKYGRRLTYLGGDGPWLLLLKCTDRWRYRLYSDQTDASIASNQPCGPECLGPAYHKVWKLLEGPPAKPPEPKPQADDGLLF